MTDEEEMKYVLEIIQIEVNEIKKYISSDYKIIYNERLNSKYREMVGKNQPISKEKQDFLYRLFESAKMY